MPPQTIGSFQILRELGRGGMGEVYLAMDSRLDRQVAMKSLPAHLSSDLDRLARFQREAKVLASLNHPGIGAIYGLEEIGGHRYLILEFIEGETLADQLKRGAIPVDESLAIARQIAEALEAAHEKGIVHRDLKPANVMITPDGVVKVLDFGLARTEDGPVSSTSAQGFADSPTLTRPQHSPTIPGVILGTAGYMSPEQARGKSVDKRSDIFSFGCVVYEMLTGIGPFAGETVTDSLGAILHREPSWPLLPPGTPPLVQMLLRRCLTKDRKQRLHDIGDARIDLDASIADPTGTSLHLSGAGLGAAAGRPSSALRWLLWTLAAAVLLLGSGLGLILSRGESSSPTRPIVRFDIEPPPGYTLAAFGEGMASLCISPAGDKIVFQAESEGTSKLFLRTLGSAESTPLPGTEEAILPFFSPDGRWLGFFVQKQLMKLPIAGGPPLAICESSLGSTAWLDDGSIVIGNFDGVWRVSSDGGKPALLSAAGPSERTSDGSASVLGYNRVVAVPGASYVLASVWDGDTLQSYSVVAVSLQDGAKRQIIKNATDARFIAPNHIVFLRESTLIAVAFDPVQCVVTGEEVQVVDAVRTSRWADAAVWAASSSNGSTMAYVAGGRSGPGRRLVRVDAAGKSTPLMDNADSIVGGLSVSPDGQNVAVVTLRQRVELWSCNLERRSLTLVNKIGESWSPVWTPDSAAMIFMQSIPGQRAEVVKKPVAGGVGGSAAASLGISSEEIFPSCMTPDGSTLLLSQRGTTKDPVIKNFQFQLNQSEPKPMEPIPGAHDGEHSFHLSPDGKLLAFVSGESGRSEIFLRTFGGNGPRLQITTAGGSEPRWSRDGKRIFFIDPREVMHAVDIDTTDGLRSSPPVRLFDLARIATTGLWGVYDALPDGSFVMVEPAAWETQPAKIRVVLNWSEVLHQSALSKAIP
ncbi:MAG: serine/threonine-protein kinase [Planctomycetes bacterium]|nr:serine/threonine-protein kinase [Planctomycetota bacterium]